MKGLTMTQVCCPSCRLRFTRAAGAYLVACPQCGKPTHPIASPEQVIGLRLFAHDDFPDAFPQAVAVAIPVPAPAVGPS
jgi:hypothetical protein